MAIIRIKRTTTSKLPEGLTFGEMAFVGASGGFTANRLYIAGPEGTCLWIGAQILNSPTFWSGSTAETTLPTVSAVDSRITTRLSSETVTSFNNQTGAIQGVSAIGATGSSWLKLAVSFTGGNSVSGATGYVNLLGATWADATTTTASTIGGIANGSSLLGKTAFEILQQLLYTYQSINSLTTSITGASNWGGEYNAALEVGNTLSNNGESITITSSVNNSFNIDPNGYSITWTSSGTNMTPSGSGTFMGATAWATSKAFTSPHAIRGVCIGSSYQHTINLSQYSAWLAYGAPPAQSGATLPITRTTTWWAPVYWGKTATNNLTESPLTYSMRNGAGNVVTVGADSTTSRLLTNSIVSPNQSFSTVNPMAFAATGVGEYLYIWVPAQYQVGAVRTGSDTGTILAVRDVAVPLYSGSLPTVSVTNANGVTTLYKRYLVNAPQTSDFNVYLTYGIA